MRRPAAAAFDFQLTFVGGALVLAFAAIAVLDDLLLVGAFVVLVIGGNVVQPAYGIRASIAASHREEAHHPPSLRLLRRRL